MALRDQPYFPLYVQDYLTDEKLNECSAATQGIYIKIMCLMHKSNQYGTILLKQKDKQNGSKIKNFASKLVRHLPFTENEIESALTELVEEEVLHIEGDKIYQKRMVKDNDLSLKRAKAGKKGGDKNKFAQAKLEANTQANSENEYEYVNESKDNNKGEKFKKKKPEEFDLLNIHEKIPDYIYEDYTDEQVKQRNHLIADELLKSKTWMDTVGRLANLQPELINRKVKEFLLKIEAGRECFNTLSEIKRHFSNWIKTNKIT